MKVSNSPLVTYTRISPNRTSPRNHEIDTISIHCAVGQFTAKQILDMSHFTTYDPKNGTSCNYAVGRDGSIGQGVDERDRSWCTSNRANDHRAITIEVASDTTRPYAVTDDAYKALIDLLVDICKRNNIKKLLWKGDKSLIGKVDQQNMTVHRWFANKECPGDYLYNRHGQIADEVNKRLDEQEDEEMTQDQFNKMFKTAMEAYRNELRDNDSSSYSEEARQWAKDNGIVAGGSTAGFNGMWEDFLTREQAVVLMQRLAKLVGVA